MIIEIKGVNFKNKGAELMLHAIIQKLRSNFVDIKIVMKPDPISPYYERAKLGIYQKFEFHKLGVDFGYLLSKLLPKSFKKQFGLVTENEIDVVLDSSGLAYSDKWGESLSKHASLQFNRMKKRGCKIIMLPQAFGPFNNPDLKKHILNISNDTDLVYARDQISYEILTSVAGESDHIKIAPDFTNLVKGTVPDSFVGKEGSICIIPNYRMIDKTDGKENNKYIPFLSSIIRELKNKGEKVFLLIHEGEQDLSLAREIVKLADSDIDILSESNPLHIKGIISQCKGIISSRFHGLVSALSQGVPALGTGWSHKYEMLYEDYDFEQGLLDVNMTDQQINKKLKFMTDSETITELNKHLLDKSETIKAKSTKMWEEVFHIIKGNPI